MTQCGNGQGDCRLSPAYEESLLNPQQARGRFGEAGPWYAAICAEAAGCAGESLFAREALAGRRRELLREAEALLAPKGAGDKKAAGAGICAGTGSAAAADRAGEGSGTGREEALRLLWKRYLLESAGDRALAFAKEMTAMGDENPYEAILAKASPRDTEWMEEYGLPVTQLERDMMKFWFAVPGERLAAMGRAIVEAFLHGFISQSRVRGARTRVRFFYQVGQEALAKEVLKAFRERGLRPVVTAPRTAYALNQNQCDHRLDRACAFDGELYEAEWAAYGRAMRLYEEELRDTCGMVGIDQFGAEPVILTPSADALQPGREAGARKAGLDARKAEWEAEWIRPSEISFCKVAFPNMLVGGRFKEVFEDFFAMNLVESEPYERQQQRLIDAMDGCEAVEIRGCKGNETRLSVSLWPVGRPEAETKFLNCGGDLNIPYGEVFTTPRLKGTSGLFHVEEICLRGVFYHDLRLVFEDGWVVDVDCEEGREYVRRNLLGPHERLTVGEFAIGTNTRAYAIARKYGLGARLPILIYEKMGPHIAVGDPCFAHSEEAAIYNMYDRKEMVCRENEHTAKRGTGENVYFGTHVDITLPYEKVAWVRGVRADGSYLELIAGGRFVLEGTQGLNEGLYEEGIE